MHKFHNDILDAYYNEYWSIGKINRFYNINVTKYIKSCGLEIRKNTVLSNFGITTANEELAKKYEKIKGGKTFPFMRNGKKAFVNSKIMKEFIDSGQANPILRVGASKAIYFLFLYKFYAFSIEDGEITGFIQSHKADELHDFKLKLARKWGIIDV